MNVCLYSRIEIYIIVFNGCVIFHAIQVLSSTQPNSLLVSTGAQSQNKDMHTKFTKISSKTIMKSIGKTLNISLITCTKTQTIHRRKNNRPIETQNYDQPYIYAMQIRTSNYNALLIRLAKGRKTNKTEHW